MVSTLQSLQTTLEKKLKAKTLFTSSKGELTLEIAPADLLAVAKQLHDDPDLQFKQLIDLCGIDYLDYGTGEWETQETTSEGFSRGVENLGQQGNKILQQRGRFAVIYHLLSLEYNLRLRLKVFLTGDPPMLPSVMGIWKVADWYEREAFDLFGILFEGHPDLRRILTDYGFIGYPFRKDFPLSGEVEMRYDATEGKVIYEPVSIEPRTLVPKVIREDSRYAYVAVEKETNG